MKLGKKTLYGQEARETLYKGIDGLRKAVEVTLGPKGKNVLIERNNIPHITKDGVTVAVEQSFNDQAVNMGAQIIKQAAIKTGEEAGDGTTTSIVLASAMIDSGRKLIAAGISPIDVKRSLDTEVSYLINGLKEISVDVTENSDIQSVATISANNDIVIGSLIASAVEHVGKDGYVTAEDSNTLETKLEIVEGLRIDRGMISPYFMTDTAKMEAVLKNPIILIFDNKINQLSELISFLEKGRAANRPVLIIADDLSNEVLSTLIVNQLKGQINVCAIKSPGFGQIKMDKLKDISIITGGTIISQDTGKTALNTEIRDLGSADKVIIKKEETIIIGGKGNPESIQARIAELKEQVNLESNEHMKLHIKTRIASMAGGIGIIQIGAATEVEMKELKDRVDDAIHATRAAVEEGIVPGGGVTELRLLKYIKDENSYGGLILKEALMAPIRKILENAGIRPDFMIDTILKNSTDIWYGYNANTEIYGNLRVNGVIDPTKVIRVALLNAASVAGMYFVTDCVMIKDEDNE